MTPTIVVAGDGPRIHALIIGVGEYAAARASTRKGKVGELLRSVERVTCAPLSAMRLARWLKSADWSKTDIPLGSVDLLLSYDGAPDGTTPADFKNIKTAWRDWQERCHAYSQNIALLYFCGHGWSANPQRYLLAEDFGAGDDWDSAVIDFTGTLGLMGECRAHTQCYFLDTCSTIPPPKLSGNKLSFSTDLRQDIRDKEGIEALPDMLVVCASPPGQPAEARQDKVTPFAKALVQTLDGLGAIRRGLGPWRIETDRIVAGIHDALRWNGHSPVCHPAGAYGSEVVHTLPGAPRVPFALECKPESALASADWTLKCAKSGVTRHHAPHAGAWRSKTEAANYELSLTFPDGTYEQETLDDVPIYPPYFAHSIQVRPR